MAYYVFRINYYEHFKMLRNELLNEKRLRQGWGTFDMQLDAGEDSFVNAWKKHWGVTDSEEYMKKKYDNLTTMLEIKSGDYIIIPKLSLKDDYVCRSFVVARCKSEYRFSVLERVGDFGHYIEIDDIFSCSYEWDDNTRTVKSKFNSYQSPLNRVRNSEFISAVDNLIKIHKESPTIFEAENKDLFSSISTKTRLQRQEYLKYIVETLRNYGNHELEDVIKTLFEKNGYNCTQRNYYDGKGGDVDIVFESFNNNTLMHNIYDICEVEIPHIYVQAKKKKGIDYGDIVGVEQLIQMRHKMLEKNGILMVINLTDEFTQNTIDKAKEHDVILIDGMTFASLLVRYGIEVELP